jgi:hypothetical protein
MIEIILSIALAIGGAILERESNGAITVNIGYSDNNLSDCKCD